MKTYENIYTVLSQADDFISGEELASQLKISRTAIWKGIKTLENKGLVIQSQKNKGYRLLSGDLLLANSIQARVSGLTVLVNEQSISTQIDAKTGIDLGHACNSLYLSPNQTAAKGRFGRPFFASEQGGIYMSLRLCPNCHFSQVKPYTVLVAASLVKAIHRLTGLQCQIKWVNDIYLGQKKIAGILTEAISSVETATVTDLVIGVGINFAIKDFPEELADKAGSLFQENASISRNDLIAEVWKIFYETPENDLIRYYKDQSLVLDRQVSYLKNGQEISGLVTDISDRGELHITFPDGSSELLSSGEVSLTSW
ncbi:bifunctional biotin--[acetyl-CoA-carboxylase] ligase/biotin operon repressor BirA [Streptococcus loxodontisalivarius]|uniref:Bifunctional ligase/repressor BirA n=1 Tax=Streptococcus loxodontisalivarius TaxID=1349415 RepID=A0ABS2PTV4_9STRE|nr:bifunctional biotin--[acetyl-CoA-carboxylase] ligase/biotin operon repressor BirA [Streptococcus loxodontisalivarius]MBM7643482.1 BirA family biotin operon repressor/biotin-[acetyl-CoA-carboxylase] ligase [Streptococcus loxodontisalivarius]